MFAHVRGDTTVPTEQQRHVLLLGDSILDNGQFVGRPQPGHQPHSVSWYITELTRARVSLVAKSGDRMWDVFGDDNSQLALKYYCPSSMQGITHIVLSCGGNDATASVTNPCKWFTWPWWVTGEFARTYGEMLDAVATSFPNVPMAVCNIYPVQVGPFNGALVNIGVRHLNYCIEAEAAKRHVHVIDLWNAVDSPEMITQGIEPSDSGGRVVAQEVIKWLDGVEQTPHHGRFHSDDFVLV